MKKLLITLTTLFTLYGCATTDPKVTDDQQTPVVYGIFTESLHNNHRIAFYMNDAQISKVYIEDNHLMLVFDRSVYFTKDALAKLKSLDYPCVYSSTVYKDSYMTVKLKCEDGKVYPEELSGLLDIIISVR